MSKRTDDLIKAYEYGIDHGLLLAEQERDSEDMLDAVGCMVCSAKHNVPSSVAPRRQPHSKEWRKAMDDSKKKFMALVAEVLDE